MKYLESYDSFGEEDKENTEISYIIKDSLIDLTQNNMRITYQVEREDNRIRVYITKYTKYMSVDFYLDEVKDPINHLISTMDEKGYPLTKASYRKSDLLSRMNMGWNVLSTTSSYYDIFGKTTGKADSFELIFKLKFDSL